MKASRMEIADVSRDHVGSLAKGLAVIEILATAPSGLRLTEVADIAGLTRAGARRLLLTCVTEGWVKQEGRQFLLTPRLLSLTRAWLGSETLWTRAEPIMSEVSQCLGESCSAAVLQGEDVVYVARVASAGIFSDILSVGTRLPAYCTALGQVLLADLAPQEFSAYLDRAKLLALTTKTVTSSDLLTQRIADVRLNGYAIADEELELGLRSIAVPIRTRSGAVVAAINVSTQAARYTCREMHDTFLPVLRPAADRIEDYLAFS